MSGSIFSDASLGLGDFLFNLTRGFRPWLLAVAPLGLNAEVLFVHVRGRTRHQRKKRAVLVGDGSWVIERLGVQLSLHGLLRGGEADVAVHGFPFSQDIEPDGTACGDRFVLQDVVEVLVGDRFPVVHPD